MGRKKKKDDGPSGPPGAPEWVVTFTDMISLLVTFFVLLMTFSSLDAYSALKIDSWLSGNRGVHKSSGFSLAEVGKEDQIAASSIERGAHQPHTRPPEELPEAIEEMGQKATEEHRELDLNNVRDGVVIEFGEDESFGVGSTEVNASLRKSLAEIGSVLEHYPHLIVVEGFTDSGFRPSQRFPDPESISVARAQSAADILVGASGLSPELVQITGHGDRFPRADNVSPSGRQLNRRVQVRILSLSKVRANHLATQRAEKRRS